MELKTQVKAGQGQQEIVISRQFDLPLELLFKAFTEADLFAQWMGTKVLKLEAENYGSYRFEPFFRRVRCECHALCALAGDGIPSALLAVQRLRRKQSFRLRCYGRCDPSL